MKCLGLIGGIGWESSALYYRRLNEDIRARFGSLHSARLILHSLSFDPLDTFVQNRNWPEAARMLIAAGQSLEKCGAEAVLLCSNQMHFLAGQIQAAMAIPLITIGAALESSFRKTRDAWGLIGTSFTLENDFLLPKPPRANVRWRERRILLPNARERARLDCIIHKETCRGNLRAESGAEVLAIAKSLKAQGAARVILASSELSLVLPPDLVPLWLDDTTELHCAHAIRWALGELPGAKDTRRVRMAELPGGRMGRGARRPDVPIPEALLQT